LGLALKAQYESWGQGEKKIRASLGFSIVRTIWKGRDKEERAAIDGARWRASQGTRTGKRKKDHRLKLDLYLGYEKELI